MESMAQSLDFSVPYFGYLERQPPDALLALIAMHRADPCSTLLRGRAYSGLRALVVRVGGALMKVR